MTWDGTGQTMTVSNTWVKIIFTNTQSFVLASVEQMEDTENTQNS